MPFEMSYYLQSVAVNGEVYVGGGITTDYESENNHTVMKFDFSSGKWTKLLQYSACDFAMVAISNQLVLVGGNANGTCSKMVGVWQADTESWVHPYPEMSMPRSRCSTAVYKEWCVVAGGWISDGGTTASIEALNTETKQWHSGPSTPKAWTAMKAAVADNVCYFMGGLTEKEYRYTTEVYSLSLPTLLTQLTTESTNTSEQDNTMWKELTALTTALSTPLCISGSLLAVGGSIDGIDTDVIQQYQPDSEEWIKVGDLPATTTGCSCAEFHGEIIVTGGYCNGHLKRTDIAKVL